jgi:D-aspartate ligase
LGNLLIRELLSPPAQVSVPPDAKSSARTPVLLFGGAETLLGAIRELVRAGYTPLVATECGPMVRWSRFFRRSPASSVAADPAADLGAWLEGLPLERAVLMRCTDDWTDRVAALPERIKARFPSSVAPPAALERLVDKWHLAESLKAAGLPAPRTIPLDATTDLAAFPDSMFATFFLKPRDSQAFFRRFATKAFRLKSREDLVAHLADVTREGLEVELQEYIPGPPSNHYFVDGFIERSGRVGGLFARRRLRMYPRDFGNSTYMESVSLAEVRDAVDTVTRLLAHVGYCGVFSTELKRDERDGVCRLIEVNTRPWWFVEFAGRCGVNVCAMAVRDALGEHPVAQIEYAAGRRCVHPYYDFNVCLELRRQGKLSIGAWARSWATSEQPVLRWSDPGPGVRVLVERVRHVLQRLFR